MFDLGPHAGYILASYAVTIVVLTAIVWQSMAAYRSAKQRSVALSTLGSDSRD